MSVASNLERQMLDLINQERSASGLAPLQLELRLNDAAEDHSQWMLAADIFSHTGAGGSSAGQRMAQADFDFSGGWGWGENIAWQSERGAPGLSDDVINLHNSLMNSPGHRANILNPNYEAIGIGIEQGNFNGWDAVIVTQNFAYTSGALALDAGSGSGGGSGGGSGPAGGSGGGSGGAEPGSGGGGGTPPAVSAPPVLRADSIPLEAGQWASVADRITVHDADGDAPLRYTFKDKSGLFDLALNSAVLTPVNGKYTINAADLDNLWISTDVKGVRKQLSVRAEDDDGWGPWEQFQVLSTPKGHKPLLSVENMVMGLSDTGGRSLADELIIVDRTDDDPLWYELRDRSGEDNFVLQGEGVIDATIPYRVSASDLDQVLVRADGGTGRSQVEIRAYDGEKLSKWEAFTIYTVPDDDPMLIV